MKRMVLFVEGEGEAEAVPKLVKRLLTEQNAWDAVSLDEQTFRVGGVNRLVKDKYREWKRKLAASLKRRNVGAVLLILDGDVKQFEGDVFCSAKVARSLASEAASVGGGVTFSVAVVFARQEYESWLIAGIDSLAGQRLPDGRLIAKDAKAPQGDLEVTPRDAKGWFSAVIEGGYKPTRDQAALTDLLDLQAVRERKLRSFQRLEIWPKSTLSPYLALPYLALELGVRPPEACAMDDVATTRTSPKLFFTLAAWFSLLVPLLAAGWYYYNAPAQRLVDPAVRAAEMRVRKKPAWWC